MGKQRITSCVLGMMFCVLLGIPEAGWAALSLVMNQPDATVLVDELSIKPQRGDSTRTEFSYIYYTYDPQPFFVPGRGIVNSPFVRITESVNCLRWDTRQVLQYQPYEPFSLVAIENAVLPVHPLLPPRSEQVVDYACNPIQGRQRLAPKTFDSFYQFGLDAVNIRQQAMRQVLEAEEISPPKRVETNEGLTAENCRTPESRAEAAKNFPLQAIGHWQDMPRKWQENAPLQMVARACANLQALNGEDLSTAQSSWPTTYWLADIPGCKRTGQACRIQVPPGQQVCSWYSKEHDVWIPDGLLPGSEKNPSFSALTLSLNAYLENSYAENAYNQNTVSNSSSSSVKAVWVSYVNSKMSQEERKRRGCVLQAQALSKQQVSNAAAPFAKPDIRISTGPTASDYAVILRPPPGKQSRVGYTLEYFRPDAFSKWTSMEVNPLLTLNNKVSSYAFGGYQEGARCWRFHLEYFDGKEWQPYSHQTPCEY